MKKHRSTHCWPTSNNKGSEQGNEGSLTLCVWNNRSTFKFGIVSTQYIQLLNKW